ncbi:MAG: ATPase domain-containing protein [Chloroflexota bacterium]
MVSVTDSTGIEGLDYVTGGLPPYGLTMIVGPPGTGKTVLAFQTAVHMARHGRDVIFLSVFAEPHEKLIDHMKSFSFFDGELIGGKIDLLSLKTVLRDGAEATVSTILATARGKHEPLIILDGYRGMRNVLGPRASQELLTSLSSLMPYHRASCLISSEANLREHDEFMELTSADAIIGLSNVRHGVRVHRSLEIYKMRGHAYREGLHTVQINGDGMTVYPRLATALPEKEPAISGRRLTFDLHEFDRMTGGGLPEFSTTVISGEPGTGKTTFGLHYLLAGARAGERGLLVTFRETEAHIVGKARGLGLHMREYIGDEIITILRTAPVEISPDVLAWKIRELVTRKNVQRIVIDDVSQLERGSIMPGANSDYLAALSEYLWRSGITTVLLRDGLPLRSMDLTDAIGVPIAQNRIVLRRVEYRANMYRICSVLSMQDTDHDTGVREFRIELGGVRILEPAQTESGVLAGIAREQPVAHER